VLLGVLGIVVWAHQSTTPVYVQLQGWIKSNVARDVHRRVRSVSCSPRRDVVSWQDGIVTFHCAVRFADGATYSTPATLEARCATGCIGYHLNYHDPGGSL